MPDNTPAAERIARAVPGGVALSVRVQPRAARTEAVGIHGHALKIRVAAAPADGAANDELRRFLARQCDVPLNAVEIVSGLTSTRKGVRVTGSSVERVRSLFHLDVEADR
jgi:uncharacterized protein (TIGR00251 family)